MLDADTYAHFREELQLSWLPPTSIDLREDLSKNVTKRDPSGRERHQIFQAGIALMAGIRLLNSPDFLNKPHFTQTAAIQLVTYGSLFQLREAVPILKVTNDTELVSDLVWYLDDGRFNEMRHALAHQGGDKGETWWVFDSDTQSLAYSTRRLRKNGEQGRLPLSEVLFASDLQWQLYSQSFLISL